VEIFLAKPVGLDLEERKDKTYICCVFLFIISVSGNLTFTLGDGFYRDFFRTMNSNFAV